MGKEEAIRIAKQYNRVAQVHFFIDILGVPPMEALKKVGIIK